MYAKAMFLPVWMVQNNKRQLLLSTMTKKSTITSIMFFNCGMAFLNKKFEVIARQK